MPQDPIGAVVRNLFLLQRAGNSISRDARTLIEALFDDVIAQLARIDPSAPRAERWRRERVQKLLGAVESQAGDVFADVHKRVRRDLAAVGAHQAVQAELALQAAVGHVGVDIRRGQIGVNMLKSILDTDPIRGELLKDWWKNEKAATVRRVRQQIQLGMAQNESIDDMVRRIRGRAVGRGKYVGGVMQTTTRDAEAIVRTAVNDIANTAHLRTFQENADVAPEYDIVATLDRRTTPICQSLDGQRFRVDDPKAPRPPFHVNCRTVIIAVVDWKALGLEPPPEGTRASATGPVPASTKYEDWLRSQPADVQKDVLGATRHKLFREGRITLRDLIRSDGGYVRVQDLVEQVGPPTPPMLDLKTLVQQRENAIAGLTIEHASAWNPATAELILEKTSGKPNYVEFTAAEAALLKDAVFTHNHPRNSSFSPEDVRFAMAHNLQQMRVTSRKFSYTLDRPDSGWSTRTWDTLQASYRDIEQRVYGMLSELVNRGQLTPTEADLRHYHEVWGRLFETTEIRYKRMNR